MYPPQAQALAATQKALLSRLPHIFAAVILRELIGYDWKFPAERLHLDGEFKALNNLPAADLSERMQDFAAIRLDDALESLDWVADPSAFLEQLTTWLWSSSQMGVFRAAAEAYAAWLARTNPVARPKGQRLCVVVLEESLQQREYPLFRRLRPHGLYLNNIQSEGGSEILFREVSRRATLREDAAYQHWYIDGGSPALHPHLTTISYEALQRPRELLLARMQQAIDSGSMGPEGLRSMIAKLHPQEIGLAAEGSDAILDRFKLSMLTEGSGTQIFATTFVQWAARECLRRAEPETLLLHYTGRQQMQPMNVLLSAKAPKTEVDSYGSLIDADMGAYYTWINMNRLSGADQMGFLVWHAGHPQALAIGPNLPQGTSSDSHLDMAGVLQLLT